MILMIDNYDSFTYNVVQYLSELGKEVEVYRNDALQVEDVERLAPERIVISPGPGNPDDAGISMAVVENFRGRIPIFGICLGMQSMAQVYGGKIVRAKKVMHGKVSDIYHQNLGVFAGLPSPFSATRYHSLVVSHESLPAAMEVTAWTQDEQGQPEEIMGLRYLSASGEAPCEGVQFHPESILSEHGHRLLENFLKLK